MTHITPDLIRAALAHIPANLAREDWARVGMAIKSEFPDTTGQDLFEAWSATADSHDARATRSTWRSIKAGGGVGHWHAAAPGQRARLCAAQAHRSAPAPEPRSAGPA